tara:strand:- start:6773 stop:8038 length:1266 start_codon:yes stop_codon:yes gene_type:complete
MTLQLKRIIKNIASKAKNSSFELALICNKKRNEALVSAAKNLMKNKKLILLENEKDVKLARKKKLNSALIDRLLLDENRVDSMCKGMISISKLSNPVGIKLSEWQRPNGLKIEKVSVPLGVIGVIYESRPNVAADAAALCLKSCNATILRGGSESFYSSSIITEIIKQSFLKLGLPEGVLQNIPTKKRDAVGYLLKMDNYIDVIVPRGGKSLIERVIKESRIHVIRHLDGICHTYIHKKSDPILAQKVVVNAKLRRTGICGATETLLIDREALGSHLPLIISKLKENGCEIRGDKYVKNFDKSLKLANEKDWETEYLDAIISIKTITNGVLEAIDHVNTYGSNHTDAIISNDKKVVELFLNKVDSGIVMHNTSTQFADGGEFGMGAEIGISTSKLHARGPVGVSQLTSFKYKVRGNGQIRP